MNWKRKKQTQKIEINWKCKLLQDISFCSFSNQTKRRKWFSISSEIKYFPQDCFTFESANTRHYHQQHHDHHQPLEFCFSSLRFCVCPFVEICGMKQKRQNLITARVTGTTTAWFLFELLFPFSFFVSFNSASMHFLLRSHNIQKVEILLKSFFLFERRQKNFFTLWDDFLNLFLSFRSDAYHHSAIVTIVSVQLVIQKSVLRFQFFDLPENLLATKAHTACLCMFGQCKFVDRMRCVN